MDQIKLVSILQKIGDLVDDALREIGERDGKSKSTIPAKRPLKTAELSFDTNVLAFMKKHGRKLPGPQKFTLLLAHQVQGKPSEQIPFSDLQKQWNKMKGVLGGKFNPAFANRAKANGWVDTPKHGVYALTGSWKEALMDKSRS